jgi:hypothetical protein
MDDPNWFCRPCDSPHEAVFARQKGYPFWPAKIMHKDDKKCEIRYFGTHEKATVHEKDIKPHTENVEPPKKRLRAGWEEARNEMQEYLDALNTTGGDGTPATVKGKLI